MLSRVAITSTRASPQDASTPQAALATVLYAELERSEDDFASIISGFDLRKTHLTDPWGKRNNFASAAIGPEMMQISVSLLEVPLSCRGTNF